MGKARAKRVGNNEERARKNENFGTKKMKFLGLINRELASHSSNPSTVRKIPHLLEKIQHKNTAFAVQEFLKRARTPKKYNKKIQHIHYNISCLQKTYNI